jgi:hypothetical protein
MGLIISVLFGKALQQVFFGRLRAIEVEVNPRIVSTTLKLTWVIAFI